MSQSLSTTAKPRPRGVPPAKRFLKGRPRLLNSRDPSLLDALPRCITPSPSHSQEEKPVLNPPVCAP